MLIKLNFKNLILTNYRQINRFNRSIFKLNYSSDGRSLDYSNLKPLDLSYIKFDAKDSNSRSPIFIYHGLFGMLILLILFQI